MPRVVRRLLGKGRVFFLEAHDAPILVGLNDAELLSPPGGVAIFDRSRR